MRHVGFVPPVRALLVCWLAALLTGKAGNFTTERYAVTISTSPGFESRQD